MPSQDATIKLLYQIFSQRFKASELQKSVDRPVKLGLLGLPADVERMRDILLTHTHRVETTEKMLLALDVEAEWWTRLADVNALLVLVPESLVKPSLFDTIKQKVPKELTCITLCYGPYSHSMRLEAHELQTEMGLRPFYQSSDLTYADVRPHVGAWVKELEAIAMPLGRRLIYFRKPVIRHFIRKVSRQNFTIALASAIPASVPILGFIAGTLAATGEMIVMTSNQLKLCLQIAGMYGMEVNFYDRMRELWPVLGSGFGWRQLSRAAVGYVPAAGPAIKSIVAYSGTFVAGESARWFYEKGRKMTAEEYRQLLGRARREALDQAKQSIERLRRRKEDEENPVLPPADATGSVSEAEPSED